MASEFRNPNERYKVGRVLAKYDLLELHGELPDLWRGLSREEMSLRELAEEINVALVRETLERTNNDPLEGEAENVYRLLTDDNVSAGDRTQQRKQLERMGIDVDQLEQDFVTHQAVYTYLTTALDISKENESEQDPLEKHEQRAQRLRSRTSAVIENSLSELQNDDQLSLGTFDVVVDIQVYCEECGTQYELSDLFRKGHCECQPSTE